MNPLKLDKKNRKMYDALMALNSTDASDESWLDRYRKVRTIIKVEGRNVVEGWRAYYSTNPSPIPIKYAELVTFGRER